MGERGREGGREGGCDGGKCGWERGREGRRVMDGWIEWMLDACYTRKEADRVAKWAELYQRVLLGGVDVITPFISLIDTFPLRVWNTLTQMCVTTSSINHDYKQL